MDEAGTYLRTWQRKIDQAQSFVPREVFVGLLLIRAVSLSCFPPGRSTLEEAPCPESLVTDLWERLVHMPDAKLADAVLNILASLQEKLPFVQELMDTKRFTSSNMLMLRKLVEMFSTIPCAPLLSRRALEQTVKRAMAKHIDKGATYSAPAALVRSLGPVLNPKGGAAYELHGELLESAPEAGGNARKADGAFTALCWMDSLLRGEGAVTENPPANPIGEKRLEWGNWDHVVANPPFNVSHWHDDRREPRDKRWDYGVPPGTNANFAWLQYCLAGLRQEGKAAVLLPVSTLIGTDPREQDIRINMVESGVVEAVITFPPGLLFDSRVPFCLWLLDKARRNTPDAPVLFVDAGRMEPKLCKNAPEEAYSRVMQLVMDFRNEGESTSDWSGVATRKEIAAAEYGLSPHLYIRSRRTHWLSEEGSVSSWDDCLEKLKQCRGYEALLACLEIWGRERPCVWQKAPLTALYTIFGGVAVSGDAFGDGVPFLDVKTIIRSPFLPGAFLRRVRLSADRQELYRIRRGDVIINRTSETLEALGLGCVALQDSEAVYTGFAKRLRPVRPDEIDPAYAAAYFRSGLYLSQIRENVPFIPVSRASLNNRHIARINMYYPPLERQQEIGEAFHAFIEWKNGSTPEAGKALTEVQTWFLQQAIDRPALSGAKTSTISEAL